MEVLVNDDMETMTETRVERNEREAIVRPAADVVAARAPELRAALRKTLAEGACEITLDFSGVSMVDSAGLGLLLATHNSLQKAGGRLSVVHAAREILDLFRSMRIHQHFQVSGD